MHYTHNREFLLVKLQSVYPGLIFIFPLGISEENFVNIELCKKFPIGKVRVGKFTQ